MKPNNNIVKVAIEQAKKSAHRFRVGAVIYLPNRHQGILGSGFNNADKTHPKSPHPFRSIHAEFSAFLHAYRLSDDLSDCSVYVHRLLANGEPGLAKPCMWCWELLVKIGVEEDNIYWSK